MASELPRELQAFQAFAREELDGDRYDVVEGILQRFRQRQEELGRLREQIEPALQQSRRGESKGIDFQQLKAAGRQRLAEEGIED